ncbi:MAG: isoprenylcysteine carboxylmethyltransferase family protein [Aureispira sp.]|nr:isoprenylcysteine carboxylmethyltransferase family protein [Aureispira sp.]
MYPLYSIFKTADSKKRKWNLLKTYLQTTIFWVVFLYILPTLIIWLEDILEVPSFLSLIFLGWSCFVFFSCLGLYSGYTMSWWGKGTPLPMDCPNELVIQGPYRIVRNPMAVAGIGQGISIGLVFGSYGTVIYAMLGAMLWHVFVRPPEEVDLEKRFGMAYQNYQKSVKCWIPTF